MRTEPISQPTRPGRPGKGATLAGLPTLALVLFAVHAAESPTITETFDDDSGIDASRSSSWMVAGGLLKLASTLDLGSGADGPCRIQTGAVNLTTGSCSGRATPDAPVTAVTKKLEAGRTQLNLGVAPNGLAVGDEVVILNLQGTSSDYSDVGEFETGRVAAISGNNLTLTAPLTHTYDGTDQKVIVQRVPNYSGVSLELPASSGRNGLSVATAGRSCLDLKRSGVSSSGLYYVDPDGSGGREPFQTWCDMTSDGGGWTRCVNINTTTGVTADYLEQCRGYGATEALVKIYANAVTSSEAGTPPYYLIRMTGELDNAFDMTERGTTWRIENSAALQVTRVGGSSTEVKNDAAWLDHGSGSTKAELCLGGLGPSSWHYRCAFSMAGYQNLMYRDGAWRSNESTEVFWRESPLLTAAAWDGTSGGLLMLRSQGAVTIEGAIDMSGKGFRGTVSPSSWGVGYRGESLASPYLSTRSTSQSQGGGGGGDAEYCYAGNGGGGGGHGTAGTAGGAAFYTCGSGWAGGKKVAEGGATVGSANLSRLTLGAGGGGGGVDGDNPDWYGEGSGGGGVIALIADRITVTGAIRSNGVRGRYGWGETGGGGGGAGGAIRLEGNVLTLGTGLVTAQGGAGGAAYYSPNGGGAGGAGRVALYYNVVSGSSSPAADTTQFKVSTSATVTSKDLLEASGLSGVLEAFRYTLTDLPAGTTAQVQFSRDLATWLASDGTFGQSDSLSAGSHSIDLAALDWEASSFYYRISFSSTGTGSPALDEVSLSICQDSIDSDGDGRGDRCDADDDGDGVNDDFDTCPLTANPDQADLDGDGTGDLCDDDLDGDGVDNPLDNCPLLSNPDQLDSDGDEEGDLCDDDDDGDSVSDEIDTCPLVANPDQQDTDDDGTGDVCDPDDDDDGAPDLADTCPLVVNPDQQDTDDDGTGDACDPDDDDDGAPDLTDTCPLVANPDQQDTDDDGTGDACDPDDDDDGIPDPDDTCPLVVNPDQQDTDNDGTGDACDPDDDDDGAPDLEDNCPLEANPGQENADGDGTGDACDADDDNDGLADGEDNCPLTASSSQSDLDNDGTGDVCDDDDDGDGSPDSVDNCVGTANPDQADGDGDGVGDACEDDLDGDGIQDGQDNCLEVANSDQSDFDRDGLGDACDDDADGDGVPAGEDCYDLDAASSTEQTYYPDEDGDGYGDPDGAESICAPAPPEGYVRNGTDNCPTVANPDQADRDGDGRGNACDPDDDGDGVADGVDNCPLLANPDQLDADGNGVGDLCEGDEDGDGVADDEDNCLEAVNPDQADLDGDGAGDACDADVDGDGVDAAEDCDDREAGVAEASIYYADEDGDGYGDPDEWLELCAVEAPEGYASSSPDNCLEAANPDQADADGDGVGDVCEEEETPEPTPGEPTPTLEPDAGSPPPVDGGELEEGCGCRQGAGSSRGGVSMALALGVLGVIRRRGRAGF